MPQPFTIADIIAALEAANMALPETEKLRQLHDDLPDIDAAYTRAAELCRDIEYAVSGLHHVIRIKHGELYKQPRTEREMVRVISREVELMRKTPQIRMKEIMPGGVEAAALRRAHGQCELCGAEWKLASHHIIPRAAGGLDDLNNIVVVCQECHDEIEPLIFTTRAKILHYIPQHKAKLEPVTKPNRELNTATQAEKAAQTRATNQLTKAKQDAELARWAASFEQYLDASVTTLALDAPRIRRPEKNWHVIVYGAGRHSRVAREELSDAPDSP